jgi:hypothetical protein
VVGAAHHPKGAQVIRTEPINVGVVRAEPQLRNAYGFTWNLADPDNTISSLAVVRAEVEDRLGRVARVVLRAGQLYQYRDPVARVWFTSASAGVLSLDVAYDEGDELVPTPPAPPEPLDFLSEFRVCPSVAFGVDYTAGAPWREEFIRPSWARRLDLFMRWATIGRTGPWTTQPFLNRLDGLPVDGAASAYDLHKYVTGTPMIVGQGVTPTARVLLGSFGTVVANAGGGVTGAAPQRIEIPQPITRVDVCGLPTNDNINNALPYLGRIEAEWRR